MLSKYLHLMKICSTFGFGCVLLFTCAGKYAAKENYTIPRTRDSLNLQIWLVIGK